MAGDGSFKSRLQSPDSYAWSLELETLSGRIIHQSGSISLLP